MQMQDRIDQVASARALRWLSLALLLVTAGCGGADDAPATLAPTAVPATADTGAAASPSPALPAASPESSPPAATPTSSTPAMPDQTATPAIPLGAWGNSEVYVISADGSGERRLTERPEGDSSAIWSPDGARIAFVSSSQDGTAGGIFVMDADGANARQLTDVPLAGPAWSPDGRWIAAVSSHGYQGGYPEIYLVAVDGSGMQQLTSFERVPTDSLYMGSSFPAWSPDSRLLAFVTERLDGPSDVYVMDVAGGQARRVTDLEGRAVSPRWSPDGASIAFATDFPRPDVYVTHADGSDPRNLTDDDWGDLQPDWAPDGQRLAFVKETDAGSELRVVAADGSAVCATPIGVATDPSPRWSPGGDQILFSAGTEGNSDLHVVNADCSGMRQLTDASHRDDSGSWSPDGATIVFTSNRDGGQPIECSFSVDALLVQIDSMEALAWMSHVVAVGTVVEELPPAFGTLLNPGFESIPPIHTDYIVDIERQFRGQPLSSVRVRTNGGTIGACTQTYDPELSLATGQRLLLFTFGPSQDDVLPPAYQSNVQGAWSVASDNTLQPHPSALSPAGYDGMTLDEVGALISGTLSGAPPPDVSAPVPIEESPLTPADE
jgi:TolB protein